MPAGGLLDAAAALVQSIAGQAHDVERAQHRDRVGQFGQSRPVLALEQDAEANLVQLLTTAIGHEQTLALAGSLVRALACLV